MHFRAHVWRIATRPTLCLIFWDPPAGTPAASLGGVRPKLISALRRSFKVVAEIVVGLWLLYVIAVNGFFLLGGVEWLTAATDDVKISFRFAWTLWPGSFHATKLRVRGQDHNVQWLLELDQADATVRMSELLQKRFHATKVRGEGASFRFRHRVSPDRLRDPSTQLLPPIAGFEDPPVLRPPPPPTDPTALWTVHLEDVDVPVRELWFQQFRYDGPARARGRFRLRPALHLWVGPASLDLGGGKLRVGSARVADAFSGHIDCRVDPFDTRVPVGRQVFR